MPPLAQLTIAAVLELSNIEVREEWGLYGENKFGGEQQVFLDMYSLDSVLLILALLVLELATLLPLLFTLLELLPMTSELTPSRNCFCFCEIVRKTNCPGDESLIFNDVGRVGFIDVVVATDDGRFVTDVVVSGRLMVDLRPPNVMLSCRTFSFWI